MIRRYRRNKCEQLEKEAEELRNTKHQCIIDYQKLLGENGKLQRIVDKMKSCIEFRATQQAIKCGLGVSEWEAFLTKEERQVIEELETKKIVKQDGLVCPRCGEEFHDTDIQQHPEKYWTCPHCYTIQHVTCRGPIEDK